MRNWLTALRPASFRGVAFRVDGEQPDGGRRVAVHEISGGEAPLTEDMGRATREISVDAWVAGDFADAAGLALEAACDLAGPALLMLPMDRPRMVRCTGCQRDRRKDAAGYVAYRLSFVEAGGAAFGVSALAALRGVFSARAGAAARAMGG